MKGYELRWKSTRNYLPVAKRSFESVDIPKTTKSRCLGREKYTEKVHE